MINFFKKYLKRGIINSADFVVLEIQVPKTTDETHVEMQTAPLAAEQMFASLHGLLREDFDLQEHFTFEFASDASGIKFYTAVPRQISKFVESQIYAQYPTSHIEECEDYVARDFPEGDFVVSRLLLSKEQFFPIKTFRDFEVDPLSAITSALSGVNPGEHVWFQVLVKPIPDVWQEEGYEYIDFLKSGLLKQQSFIKTLPALIVKEIAKVFFINVVANGLAGVREDKSAVKSADALGSKVSAGKELEIKSIENKLSKMGFESLIRVISYAPDLPRAEANMRSVIASMKQFSTSNLNSFMQSIGFNKETELKEFKNRTMDFRHAYVLNIEELASIFHLPSSSVETPNISWVYSKKSEPPANLPTTDCTYIGETTYRNKKIRFGIKNGDDRLRHMYLIGKTGTGKSSLFETMVAQDIKNGFGVGVLDPHGELIDKILNYIPDERVDDVVIFDPSDIERPVGLNLLELTDSSQKNLIASGLVSAFKKHFEYSWGPRLEYLLNYAILTLLEVEGTTLLGVTRLLEDMNYQKYILHKVKDPVTVGFWENEYKNMRGNQKLITEAVAPIQNKVNRFLSSTTMRNILGQRKSTIDIWDVMNSGKILLMNLSKGKIGEDNANLLGALLVSRIQFMALQRVKIDSEKRRPFYLYVDEFQNFATGSFESILSESRKYKLGLYLTHQYTGQLSEELINAVFGNVGTIASFALGALDAKEVAAEFTPFFEETDIISLERFNIYMKLMVDGMTSLPFSARILVPWEETFDVVKKTNNREKVIRLSREKFGVDYIHIEDKIRKWVEKKFDKGVALAEEQKNE